MKKLVTINRLSNLPRNAKSAIESIDAAFDLSVNDMNDIYLSGIDSSTEYVNDVLVYIAGFIFVELKTKEQCIYCFEYLQNLKLMTNSAFVNKINRGGLTYPPECIFFIVKVTDSFLKKFMKEKKVLAQKHMIERTTLTVTSLLNMKRPDLFSSVDLHVDNNNVASHKLALIGKVVACYTTLRKMLIIAF